MTDGHDVESLIERYGTQWIATARRSCSRAEDAEDAYQRALEKLLTQRPDESDPERIAAWMHTVVRNEALQIVRGRRREAGVEFDAIVAGLTTDEGIPESSAIDGEDHRAAMEALRRMRPDQVRCLLLRADGFDYPEICRVTGFSYAKVNRLLSEGRKAARVRVESIVAGHECLRIEPVLSMIADGVADEAAERDARLHLEHCVHCQATLRDYAATPSDLASVLPLGLVSLAGWRAHLRDPFERMLEFAQARLGDGGEAFLPAAKKSLAALAVVTAVGGGVAIQQSVGPGGAADAAKAADAVPSRTAVSVAPRASANGQRKKRKRAVSPRPATSSEAAENITRDRSVAPADRLSDTTADDSDGFAANPADTQTDGSGESLQSGALAP